jgi:putative transposase
MVLAYCCVICRLVVVLRLKETRKLVLLPRRWVVERTFSWLNHSHRLSKNYERLTAPTKPGFTSP